MALPIPSPEIFECIQSGEIDELDKFNVEDLRPFLPMLLRAGLSSLPCEANGLSSDKRMTLLRPLTLIDVANQVAEFLQIDFAILETDVKKEAQLRQKHGSREQDSVLLSNLKNGVSYEYERGDADRRIRLVLSELFFILSQIHEPRQDYYMKESELFDTWVYLEDLSYAICATLFELPNVAVLTDVCEAMLHVKYGPWIIPRLVANMPDAFSEVCFTLIANGDKWEEDSEGGLIRLEALRQLCKMCPQQTLMIRSRCVETCKMPALTVLISLENEELSRSFVPFVSGMILGTDQQIKNWFSTYIKNNQKKKLDATSSLIKMRENIFSNVKRILGNSSFKKLKECDVVEASSILRLCVALKSTAAFKFQDDEISSFVSLITLKAPSSPIGSRFVVVGLCTLIACPSLLASDQEKSIIEYIKFLIKEETPSMDGENSSFGEILLLIAIHFHSNQLNAVSELVGTTLGMKVSIRVNTMTRIKQIFTQEIFTEQVVTAHAVRVPVTSGLNANLSGFLPVHCIYQLIKSRAFTKHKVPIKDWIYRQILESKFPIHPVLPSLLDVYTQSILVPGTSTVGTTKVLLELTNEPLTDEEVLKVYNNSEEINLVPQLLVLYYLILYEEYRLMNCRNLLQMGKKVKCYSGKLFSQVPIKYLLQEAQKAQNRCGGLFPPLLKLLTIHFPQLSIVNEWLEDKSLIASDDATLIEMKKSKKDIKILPGSFAAAFNSCVEKPLDVIRLLEMCKNISPPFLWKYAKEFVSQLRKIIQPSVPRRVQDLYREVWYELNDMYPRRLWEMTANALLPSGSLSLTADDITLDPLQVLRCDPKVYRCAPILNIVLHILAASIASSKYYMWKHIQENPSLGPPGMVNQADMEKEELKITMMAVQDSAAVQILLEACLFNEDDKDGVNSELTVQEIRSVVCSYLHQLFITDPTLAKLVHFQGYPLELIPVTVKGVPSMHICLDWLPELLHQADVEKQVFAIQLTSHLSIQYSLPKSYGIAKSAVNAATNAASCIVSGERSEFFIPILSSLERLARAFPPLVDEIVMLLGNLGKICAAQNAVERNRMSKIVRNKQLLLDIHETYRNIVQHAMLGRKLM